MRCDTGSRRCEEGEIRVSLTFEYVTDARISRGWRLISNMKDALGYFGFRQVFVRRARGSLARRPGRDRREKAGLLALLRGAAAPRRASRLAGAHARVRDFGDGGVGPAAPGAVSSAAALAGCGGDPGTLRSGRHPGPWRESLLARWVGESANSLMPARPGGGPGRHDSSSVAPGHGDSERGGGRYRFDYAAGARAICVRSDGHRAACAAGRLETASARHEHRTVIVATLIASTVLAVILVSFYLVQRRGLFGGAVRRFARLRAGTIGPA